MDILIKRHTFLPTSTLGDLYLDGEHFCYTLERPSADLADATEPFCIPEGQYGAIVAFFPHMGEDAVLLSGTEPRTGIFIHVGNYPKNTEGCILVGLSQSADFVGNSKDAFERLMRKVGKNSLTVKVEGGEAWK